MNALKRSARATFVAVALVCAPLGVAVLAADPAAAAVITVDNTGDPAVANPANCPAVPAGTCTLRDAIAAADANPGADTVSVSVGPISLTHGGLNHASTGALTLTGNGNTVTQTTANEVLFTNGPLTVNGLVTSGGTNALDAAGPVSVSGTSLTTTNGHGVVSFGGGTSAAIDSSTITSSEDAVFATQDVTVSSSTLTSSAGVGALASAGNVAVAGSTVSGVGGGASGGTNATITDSSVTSATGIGVLAGSGGAATISGSTVAGQAGGIQAGLNVTVTGSTVTSAGGIGVLSLFGTVTVTDSWITGASLAIVANAGATALRAEIQGGPSGGVLAVNGNASITSSTVTGGGHFGVRAPDQVVIVNSTITGNGGCGAYSPDGKVTLVYATVVDNGTVNCGFNVSALTLESFSSVVALHAPNCSVTTTVSHGYNFSDDNTCGFTDSTDTNNGGNPLLGLLADNGGPTLTRLPQAGSPLIDGVAMSACSADGASTINPLVDQRAIGRPSGTGCDIGAVEVQASPAIAPAVVLAPRFTG